MRSAVPQLLATLVLALGCLTPLAAQPAAQGGDPNLICNVQIGDLLMEKVLKLQSGSSEPVEGAKKDGAMRALAANELAKGPLMRPASEQIGAPANGDASTTLVNGAGFPTLFGMALDRGLVSSAEGTLTLNFSPFDVKALTPGSDVLDRQSKYEEAVNSNLRRIGLALTFGGKGESFDRDGDGTADPALEAQNLEDIVRWEVRWRFFGSRDRRDKVRVDEFFRDPLVGSLFAQLDERLRNIETPPGKEATEARLARIDALREGDCFKRDALGKFLIEVAPELEMAADVAAQLKTAVDAANRTIDGSWVWSLVAGGTERRDDFGRDVLTAGLRGAMGIFENQGLTLNLDYTRTENPGEDLEDEKVWKLGAEYAILAFKRVVGKDGVRISGSGAYEMFDDVPSAGHDTNAKLNAKLEFPLTDSIKIPISVTWANHSDLLEDEDEIRGHVGFTVDLSKLKDLKP